MSNINNVWSKTYNANEEKELSKALDDAYLFVMYKKIGLILGTIVIVSCMGIVSRVILINDYNNMWLLVNIVAIYFLIMNTIGFFSIKNKDKIDDYNALVKDLGKEEELSIDKDRKVYLNLINPLDVLMSNRFTGEYSGAIRREFQIEDLVKVKNISNSKIIRMILNKICNLKIVKRQLYQMSCSSMNKDFKGICFYYDIYNGKNYILINNKDDITTYYDVQEKIYERILKNKSLFVSYISILSISNMSQISNEEKENIYDKNLIINDLNEFIETIPKMKRERDLRNTLLEIKDKKETTEEHVKKKI